MEDKAKAVEAQRSMSTEPTANILVVSLEFTYSPFSGNGLYCRSLVRSLLRTGGTSVAVLCAKPHHSSSDLLSPDHHFVPPEISQHQADRLHLWPVDLPPNAPWKKLDEYGPWEEFRNGAAETYLQRSAATKWKPNVVLAVDWHGGLAWRSIANNVAFDTLPKVCCFNFRVYSSGLCPSKAEWYDEKERLALEVASDVVCLSRPDMQSLENLLPEASKKAGVGVALIHPALRGDMHELAEEFNRNKGTALDTLRKSLHPAAAAVLGQVDPDHERRFVTCAVRLSREKNPMAFVEVVVRVQETMSRLGLIPLLCGAASDEQYAKECRDLLLLHYPDAVVIGDFLGPQELASIFAHTYVNFHPCKYDSFGMTAIEASAFGAPSIINGRDVGARPTELLKRDGFMEVDFAKSLYALARDVETILSNINQISAVREEAYRRAMSWDEDASGQTILRRLKALI